MTVNRPEYGEKSITKLQNRIDEIEDDIVRQKQKIMKTRNISSLGKLEKTLDFKLCFK